MGHGDPLIINESSIERVRSFVDVLRRGCVRLKFEEEQEIMSLFFIPLSLSER